MGELGGRADCQAVGVSVSRPGVELHHGWRWAALFAAFGGMALAVQVYLLREYLVTLEGDETALGLGLGAWLTGIALGAGLARRFTAGRPQRQAAYFLGGLAVTGTLGLVLARVGRRLVGLPAGELLALGPAMVLAAVVFVLPGALVGAGFVALASSAANLEGGAELAIGRLYVYEALGSLLAGLVVSLVTLIGVAPLSGIALLLAFMLGATLPAARARLIGGRRMLPAVGALVLMVGMPPCARALEAGTQRIRFATLAVGVPLVDWDDTPYQHVDIGGDDSRVLYTDGQYVTSFPDPTEHEMRAHRLMLLGERPTRVLAFGALETGALRFCLGHGIQRVDLVLLDQQAFELVLRYLPAEDRRALEDPRVQVIFDDPRRFLTRVGPSYDLVALLGPDPVTLLGARSTTLEFHRLVSARLAPRGTYVTHLTTGANVQTGQTGRMGASLFRTLHEVFPVVRAVPGPDGLLVAGKSREAVTLDPSRLEQRYRARALSSEVLVPELLPELFPVERVSALENELSQSLGKVPQATDDRPVSLMLALTVRQEIAQSAWAPILGWAMDHPAAVALAMLWPSGGLALVLFVRRRRPSQPTSHTPPFAPRMLARGAAMAAALHATMATGACGMAWTLMAFFSFQTRVGALYSELGALSALFMLGLAAGGWWGVRLGSHRRGLLVAQTVALGSALALALAFAALHLASGRTVLTLMHALLLTVAGVGTGVVFPSAVAGLLEQGAHPRTAAAWIESLDHLGAAVAALFAAVLWIPTLGLTATGGLLLVLQALGWGITAHALGLRGLRKSPVSVVHSSGTCLLGAGW
jgi:spermidine synthase